MKAASPFADVEFLGSSLAFRFISDTAVVATLHVHDKDVIPKQSFSLLKSGRLSVKDVPKTKYHETYHDYVCGCALRVGREVTSLLPVEYVLFNAKSELLNSATGHLEDATILSVLMPRSTLKKLNFEALDPSDSMSQFVHRVTFKKATGFSAVSELDGAEVMRRRAV